MTDMTAIPRPHRALASTFAALSIAAALVVYTGCSASSDEGSTAQEGGDSPALRASSANAAACRLDQPFGTPVAVPGIEPSYSVDRFAPHLTPDERTVYYSTTDYLDGGFAGFDIVVATRPDRAAPFGAPKKLVNVNSWAHEMDPRLSPDGNTLFFTSTRGGRFQIYRATRSGPSADFGIPEAMPSYINDVGGGFDVGGPFMRFDGAEFLYVARFQNGDADIFRSVVTNGTFGTPTPVQELTDAGGVEHFPVLSSDGLTIFFASTRSTGVNGNYDIWTATRTTSSSPFTNIHKVTELATNIAEWPSWVSPDGCRLYFGRDRTDFDGRNVHAIYVASRPE